MKRSTLSVAFIAFNEEDRIGEAIASIKDIADEIIVVDSCSTDKTVTVAKQLGAKVITHAWKGFVAQKNYLFSQCSCDYILNLDCDEIITKDLADEIQKTLSSPQFAGYTINRKTRYFGKLLRYSWQPDLCLRLVSRASNPIWQGKYVHESLKINGFIGKLDNYMEHNSFRSLSDQYLKTVKYAQLAAKQNLENGKRFSWGKLIFSPWVYFIKQYFIKRGFLDGYRGLLVAISGFIYGLLKYQFMLEDRIKK